MKTVLSIAGSDSSGGAGIQADIKTMTANGVYAMTAITALTAQNTSSVTAIMPVTLEFFRQQMDAVFTDIRPDAVKVGMIPSPELAEAAAQRLRLYKASNIVVDPVMVSTAGSRLSDQDTVRLIREKLFPMAAVVTPNIPEAEVLTSLKIRTHESMMAAAKQIGDTWGCAVLCKGGHLASPESSDDILYSGRRFKLFEGRRVNNPNSHGTGCTLSSAIALFLAKGCELEEAVRRAKEYVEGALAAMLDLGSGSGPLNHMYAQSAPGRV